MGGDSKLVASRREFRAGLGPVWMLILLSSARPAGAQEVDWEPWFACGPFGPVEEPGSFEEGFWPEKDLRLLRAGGRGPNLERHGPGVGDVDVGWGLLRMPEGADARALDVGRLDFRKLLPPPAGVQGWSSRAAVYLYRRIDARAETRVTVVVGAEHAARLWLNGAPVIDVGAGDEVLALELVEGTNHLLVELVSDRWGELGLRLSSFEPPDPEQVRVAVAEGIAFLVGEQLPDGSFEGWGAAQPTRTAYVLEALLAAGLAEDHPSVRMAEDFLLAREAESTAARAAVLAAAARLRDPAREALVLDALAGLAEAQDRKGLWGHRDRTDAVVRALAAARAAGRELPADLVRKLATGVEETYRPNARRGKKYGRAAPAGFAPYDNREAEAHATTQALAAIGFALDVLGEELPKRRERQLRERGLETAAWLDEHARWDSIVGAEDPYLHHLESLLTLRLAQGLLGLRELGGWDLRTAVTSFLFDHRQVGTGAWSYHYRDLEVRDTATALLLFAGWPESYVSPPVLRSEAGQGAAAGLRLAVSITHPPEVWIERTGTEVAQRLGDDVRVERVEILGTRSAEEDAEETVVGALDGGPFTLAELVDREIPVRVSARAAWKLTARLVPSEGDADSGAAEVEGPVRTGGLWVWVGGERADETAPLSTVAGGNLLADGEHELEVSSSREGHEPTGAVDDNYGTAWISAPEDRAPRFTLRPAGRPLARQLWLSHAHAVVTEGWRPQARRVRVVVNGSLEHSIEMPADPWQRGHCDFGELLEVESLELTVLDSRNRIEHFQAVGFSEIELRAD